MRPFIRSGRPKPPIEQLIASFAKSLAASLPEEEQSTMYDNDFDDDFYDDDDYDDGYDDNNEKCTCYDFIVSFKIIPTSIPGEYIYHAVWDDDSEGYTCRCWRGSYFCLK